MQKKSVVLAIDDDRRYLENIQFALEKSFHVFTASSYAEAEEVLNQQKVSVIMLDYYLGRENGHDILDRLRKGLHKHPIVIVSGVVDLQMTVGFLKRRVFGFLEKPVSLPELESLLHEAAQSQLRSVIENKFEIDARTRTIHFNNKTVSLTPTEFEILNFFTKHAGHQVTREQITLQVWGPVKISKNSLDTHILNLKKKLPPFAESLISIYGTGFCYEP